MTREETKQMLMVIQATYPNYKPPEKAVAINAWTMALEEYPYKAVEIALKAYIKTDTSGFAPSPGQVIQSISQKNTQNLAKWRPGHWFPEPCETGYTEQTRNLQNSPGQYKRR